MSSETMQTAPGQAEVKGGVSPYLTLDGAARAADFYKQALAAEEAERLPAGPDGRLMHCHLYINGGSVMLSDPFPEHGHAWVAPAGFSLTLQVQDADAWYERAVQAGAEPVTPVADMFWGARYGQVRDPFGVIWAFNSPKS